MEPRICVVCGKPIPATRSNQAKTCSEICRIEWQKIKSKRQNEKRASICRQQRLEAYNDCPHKCRICGNVIPHQALHSVICQPCLDRASNFDGFHCIICGKELSTIRLLAHPRTMTCSKHCQDLFLSCHSAIHREQVKRLLTKQENNNQLDALNEQKEIELKALKTCHGWIDTYGKKHPCNRKTTNYRCDSCWSKMRSSVVDDTDE